MRRTISSALALVAVAALAGVAAAGAAPAKGKPALSATPVFRAHLKPSQEVPRIKGLRADAVGHVTFDVTRAGTSITSGEVVFYFNYAFPGPVTITGLHVHQGAKGTNGPVVVSSGVGAFADADGQGNVTAVVVGAAPALLQAILDKPRDYYVNLHTSDHPGGALRVQLHNPKKR